MESDTRALAAIIFYNWTSKIVSRHFYAVAIQ